VKVEWKRKTNCESKMKEEKPLGKWNERGEATVKVEWKRKTNCESKMKEEKPLGKWNERGEATGKVDRALKGRQGERPQVHQGEEG
jgi:hypothetical protein